jgi:hypothetical protein
MDKIGCHVLKVFVNNAVLESVADPLNLVVKDLMMNLTVFAVLLILKANVVKIVVVDAVFV